MRLLQPRHHRLRLRDRREQGARQRDSPGHRLPAVLRGGRHRRRHRHLQRQPRQRGPRRGHGVRQRQLRAPRLRRCSTPTTPRRRSSTPRSRPTARRRTYSVKFTSNEASSIYYTTDGSTPDHGLDRVEAEPAARAAGRARPRARHDAEVDRGRLQGQHVRGQVAGPRPDRHARHRRRGVGGDAGADAGCPGDVRRVHPGRRQDYTAATTATVISTAGDATLSVADPSTTATGRLVNGTFALTQPAAGPRHRSRRGPPRPPTSRSRSRSRSPSRPTSRCARARTAKTLTFTLSTTTP